MTSSRFPHFVGLNDHPKCRVAALTTCVRRFRGFNGRFSPNSGLIRRRQKAAVDFIKHTTVWVATRLYRRSGLETGPISAYIRRRAGAGRRRQGGREGERGLRTRPPRGPSVHWWRWAYAEPLNGTRAPAYHPGAQCRSSGIGGYEEGRQPVDDGRRRTSVQPGSSALRRISATGEPGKPGIVVTGSCSCRVMVAWARGDAAFAIAGAGFDFSSIARFGHKTRSFS